MATSTRDHAATPSTPTPAPLSPSSSSSTSHSPPAPQKKKKNLVIHLLAGGVGGFCEALSCHPLDTIKVRLQLRSARAKHITPPHGKPPPPSLMPNFIRVGAGIIQNEGFPALYKGLGAVVSGIVPKMAIRFFSFEVYKDWLASASRTKTQSVHGTSNAATSPPPSPPSSAVVFLAGLGAGATESVLVVTPMDVIKIRLQAQRHSMSDPLDIPKYRNAAHCAYVMAMEEGIGSLYKGVGLTIMRQSTNQAANFTVYQFLKSYLTSQQSSSSSSDAALPSYQHLAIGFISGACGPLFNAPLDTIKTRIQKTPSKERAWKRFVGVTRDIYVKEGVAAFYKGLTPRVLRVAPGQAITFMVYERVYAWLVEMSQKPDVSELETTAFRTSRDGSCDGS